MSGFCIGLTGGIASGKSFVEERFVALGVPVLDADQVARAVVEPGTPALAEIAACFGRDFLQADGSLDRRKMREHAFADPAALRQLEAITHPAMRTRVHAWREAQQTSYCLYSAAILVEAGMSELVDRVLVVDAPVDVQIARLVRRDGGDEALARRMVAAQSSRLQRLAAAHDILDNSAGDTSILPQIARLHRLYRYLATTRATV
ncbi:MAG TPA: dephospho-CoA kinase [Nevskiaceae bacterium]|nr:dephospho-CoA kinase [Nevskiaceae bacterium]